MLGALAWIGGTMVAALVGAICGYRFRLALRRNGVKVMDIWERAGSVTNPGAIVEDDFAVMSQLLKRQSVPAAERWRLATIASFAVALLLIASPGLIGLT